MSEQMIGGSFHSISHSGVDLFKQRIVSGVGGIVIDLVSAAIPPGEYTLDIETGVGGIEIYLPRYVLFTVDSNSGIGSTDVTEGLGWWNTLAHKVRDALHLPNQIPDHAVAAVDPSKPVKIHLKLTRGVGGVDIYRL